MRERAAVLIPWPAVALPVIVGCCRERERNGQLSTPTVFICYSRDDKRLKDRVEKHLCVLGKLGLLEVWHDQRIGAGQDWLLEIQNAMQRARVAILLISHNFLTSDFILGEEVPNLLKRREEEGLKIVPVLLSQCVWAAAGWLAAMQIRPDPKRPLKSLKGDKLDDALTKIVEEVRGLLASQTLREKSRPDDDSDRRGKHREKIVRALADQLDRLFDDKQISPCYVAAELEIEKIPDEPAMIPKAIVYHLVDCED